ncbi:MAG: nodulation protein NfeD [Chitinophagaceae bacterium]|nr:nodulation protein NfeD [Chitinophagaceae bacterium]MBL0306382.1 nodulation protein NfeD [Chitinophagaceae bacterium]HQV87163.1 nodulation protein NfeD [Chitinophagaceae bacterium]HQX74288.1 nodulation protein NfeD [Chitinophagaceae bacterium]HQZ76103.1 nodulation protein NfeD [Chitinophagaceae bacterium]
MKHFISYCFFLFLLPAFVAAQTVVSIKVEGAINPVTASFIHDGIQKAAAQKAECLLIHLNTPGGLLKSTRLIVSDILESPVPVIVYVSPAGAQSGSAGVFITLAAHIAAMAPGTNIGAAHPVSLQGPMDSIMGEKVTNDAAAFIRSIAEKRKRNMEWAENSVRKSFAYSETEALDYEAIDLIATNVPDLLNQLEGKIISLQQGTVTLHTKAAKVEVYSMNFFQQFLHIISDPSIAYILLLLGLFGILLEFFNPGAIVPGVVGGISLILAYYAMHTLPINFAGLALILFALILFLLEIKIVSHGVLAIGGVVSLLLGSLMLIKPGSALELAAISRPVIIAATAVASLLFLFIIGAGIKAQRHKVVTGLEALIGDTGEVITILSPTGTVQVQGEIWNAESMAGTINPGEKVRIKEMKNLKLYVEPIAHT